MPLVFMNVQPDWDAAILAGVLPAVGLAYANADDKHGTMVYLNFAYQGEEYHISVPLAEGGVASSFHVTSEKPKPLHLDTTSKKKAGTTHTVKNNPTAYYDFTIVDGGMPTVQISAASSVVILGSKTQKVFSASFTTPPTTSVKNIMTAFALYMFGLGAGHATAG